MDTTTNFENNFPEWDITVDTTPDLFGSDGEEYLSVLSPSSHTFISDPVGLCYNPDMTMSIQDQGRAHLTQLFCGHRFLDWVIPEGLDFSAIEDEYPMPGIMTDYDATSSVAPSTPMPGEYLDTANYCLTPSSLQIQAGSLPSRNLFSTTGKPMANGNQSANLRNMPRTILPRPEEQASVNLEIGQKRREENAMKCPSDLMYVLSTKMATDTF
jgi:hypothetical protein